MELFKEILSKPLMKEEIDVSFPNLKFNMVEMESFKVLQKIKTII